ncbi:UNVERIFIED_CONTAM: hypothetical protein FKN15_058092 [Acipenser sinensis]
MPSVALVVTLILVLGCNTPAVQGDSCAKEDMKFKGTCYKFVKQPVSWTQAQKFCISKGGNLLHSIDGETKEFLNQHLDQDQAWWVGQDLSDGETSKMKPTDPPSWLRGSRVVPSASDNDSFCTYIILDPTLQLVTTSRCNLRLYFVCQKEYEVAIRKRRDSNSTQLQYMNILLSSSAMLLPREVLNKTSEFIINGANSILISSRSVCPKSNVSSKEIEILSDLYMKIIDNIEQAKLNAIESGDPPFITNTAFFSSYISSETLQDLGNMNLFISDKQASFILPDVDTMKLKIKTDQAIKIQMMSFDHNPFTWPSKENITGTVASLSMSTAGGQIALNNLTKYIEIILPRPEIQSPPSTFLSTPGNPIIITLNITNPNDTVVVTVEPSITVLLKLHLARGFEPTSTKYHFTTDLSFKKPADYRWLLTPEMLNSGLGTWYLKVTPVDYTEKKNLTLRVMSFTSRCLFWNPGSQDWSTDGCKRNLTLLTDNNPYAQYRYLLTVYTGHRRGAGTSAKVVVTLIGSEGESDPHHLTDPEKPVFERGGVDMFLLTTPFSLGELQSVNSGDCPACNIFHSKTTSGFRDQHIWISVLDPPHRSPFTRVQRVSCCMSLLLCTMAVNIMFWNLPVDPNSPVVFQFTSALVFTSQEIMIGVESALLMFPINILIITIFRSIKPKDPNSKESKKNDLPKKSPCPQTPSEAFETLLKDTKMLVDALSKNKKNNVPPLDGDLTSGTDFNTALDLVEMFILQLQGEQNPSEPHWIHASRYVCLSLLHVSKGLEKVGPEFFPSPEAYNYSANRVKHMVQYLDQVCTKQAPERPPPPPSSKKKKGKSCSLPWWFVFIGWFMLLSISVISTFFTMLYGLKYGKESSIKWVLSMGLSLFQSIFILQPLKVVGLAIFFALILKRMDDEESDEVEKLLSGFEAAMYCAPHQVAHGGSCFELLFERRSFYEAQSHCEGKGGHLAFITQAETQASLQLHLEHGTDWWIGLADRALNGNEFQKAPLSWLDGTALSFTNWLGAVQRLLFTSQCGYIQHNSGYHWSLTPNCAQKLSFICQFGQPIRTQSSLDFFAVLEHLMLQFFDVVQTLSSPMDLMNAAQIIKGLTKPTFLLTMKAQLTASQILEGLSSQQLHLSGTKCVLVSHLLEAALAIFYAADYILGAKRSNLVTESWDLLNKNLAQMLVFPFNPLFTTAHHDINGTVASIKLTRGKEELKVKGVSRDIEDPTVRLSTSRNMLTVSVNVTAPIITLVVCIEPDIPVNMTMYLGFGVRPLEGVILESATFPKPGLTGELAYTWVLEPLSLSKGEGVYFITAVTQKPSTAPQSTQPSKNVTYSVTTFSTQCLFWNTSLGKWSAEGCKVGPRSTLKSTQCLCTHLTFFTTSFFVQPNTLDLRDTVKLFADVSNNPVVVALPHHLTDPEKPVFERGGVDMFLLTTPFSLGELQGIRLWHHNTGDSPAWYVNKVSVYDLEAQRKWPFLCNCWLAADIDGATLDRFFPPATESQLTLFRLPSPSPVPPRGCELPWCFVYLGWLCVFLTSGLAAFFTMMYGLKMGRVQSTQWLVAMAVTLFQSIFILQPLKVLMMALFLSLILKKRDPDGEDNEPLKICVTAHLLFLSLLMVIAYAARKPNQFYLYRAVHSSTSTSLEWVREIQDFYPWANTTLLPNLYGEYRDEDTADYGPGWTNSTTGRQSGLGQAWQYHTAASLQKNPVWGRLALYQGGGYAVELGTEREQAYRVLSILSKEGWLDQRSRALLVEFNVFNANVNLFCVVTLALETSGMGSPHEGTAAGIFQEPAEPGGHVNHPDELDRDGAVQLNTGVGRQAHQPVSRRQDQVQKTRQQQERAGTSCKNSLLVNLVWDFKNSIDISNGLGNINTALRHKQLPAVKASYLQDKQTGDGMYSHKWLRWLWFFLNAAVDEAAVSVDEPSLLLSRFVSFEQVVLVDSIYNYLIAFLVCLATVKLWHLLRLNPKLYLISSAIRRAWGELNLFLLIIVILIISYSITCNLLFGWSLSSYSTVSRSAITILCLLMGSFNYNEVLPLQHWGQDNWGILGDHRDIGH